MKTRLTVSLTDLLTSIVKSAQNYSVRVNFDTNLRAANCHRDSIVETAPAAFTASHADADAVTDLRY